jgi:hypothetical protein
VSLLLQRGRSRGEGEGALGVDGGHQGVSGERGEIGKQATEAVHRKAVFGSASGLLGDGGGRALGFGNDAGAQRLGSLLVGVVVEHRGQPLAHVPFEIVRQHTQKHMGAHPVGQPMVDRPDLQIDGLDAAEARSTRLKDL